MLMTSWLAVPDDYPRTERSSSCVSRIFPDLTTWIPRLAIGRDCRIERMQRTRNETRGHHHFKRSEPTDDRAGDGRSRGHQPGADGEDRRAGRCARRGADRRDRRQARFRRRRRGRRRRSRHRRIIGRTTDSRAGERTGFRRSRAISIRRRSSAVSPRGPAAQFALANYRHALRAASPAATRTPSASRRSTSRRCASPTPSYDDEIGFTADVLGTTGPATEFNVLEGLWNARVTSHVPLSDCRRCSTSTRSSSALELTADCVARGGFRPAADRRRRAQSARRRRRQLRPRGDRHHRAGGRGAQARGHRAPKVRFRPTRCSCARGAATSTRC